MEQMDIKHEQVVDSPHSKAMNVIHHGAILPPQSPQFSRVYTDLLCLTL